MLRLAVLVLGLLAAACAPAPVRPVAVVAPVATSVPAFSFADDTFAFRNEISSRHPGVRGLYAHHCFVLARGVRQFHQFARFDPALPRVEAAEYERLVRAVASRPPWRPSLPPDARIVIPGYRNLREFSAAQEAAVKAGLGGPFWTWVHWTNWRVAIERLPAGHQSAVMQRVRDELAAGQLVQLLVTNWPKPELNHTVVAYGYRPRGNGLDLIVWDPNDPEDSGVVTFEASADRFWATRVYDTEPGTIRVFRMYYSWFL
ncbi:MAG TPA: hypothetical protein VHZ49_22960 [Methylomirabilota bacterium]|nr:hypothetical protein [Methylomirabilota bacterium]